MPELGTVLGTGAWRGVAHGPQQPEGARSFVGNTSYKIQWENATAQIKWCGNTGEGTGIMQGNEGEGEGERSHKNTIPAPSSPTHMLTLTLRRHLKIRSMTKLFHCKSPFTGLQQVKVYLHATPCPQPPPRAVSGHPLCASHCTQHLVSINLFNPYDNLMRLMLSSPRFYRWRKRRRKGFLFCCCFLKKTST